MPKKTSRNAKRKSDRRAPRGTGSCFYSTSRRCWIARKPIGKKGKNTLYLTRTADTQAEAIRRRDAALPPDPESTTVAQWAERWLEATDVREQTRDSYRTTIDLRIVPHLGPRNVAAVTPFDVERAALAWGKEVSANSVRKHLAHLRALFGAARRAGLVASNPVSLARQPKATKVEIDPFTADELAAVVAAAVADPKAHRLAVMAATGCRIGEAIAFLPADVSPTGSLSINKTRTMEHGVGPPKSANGVRTVRLPGSVRPAACAPGPEISHQTAAKRWSRLLAALGLRARGPHQARHTVATLAIAAGVPIANVARDLGDSVQTIIATYLHPTDGADVCGAIEGLLGGNRVTDRKRKAVKVPGKKPRRAKRG